MIDFFNANEKADQVATGSDAHPDEIRAALLSALESVLFAIYPAGKKRKGKFTIGDALGSPGDSLEILLAGDKAGLWTDRATGGRHSRASVGHTQLPGCSRPQIRRSEFHEIA